MMAIASIRQLVYVKRLQLVSLSADCNADNYKKLLPKGYSPFGIL